MALADLVVSAVVTWLTLRVLESSERRGRGRPAPLPVPPRPPGSVPPPGYAPASTAVPWPKGDVVPATPETAQRETVPLALQPKPTPQSAANPFLLKQEGKAAPQTEYAAVLARERAPYDRSYWRPRARPAPAEVKRAVELVKNWKDGLVLYEGPRTYTGRRQYRATKHGTKKAIEVWEPAPPFV